MKRKKISLKKEREKKIKEFKHLAKGRTLLKLKCRICKRIFDIRVNDESVYTEKVKKEWICLLGCRCNGKK